MIPFLLFVLTFFGLASAALPAYADTGTYNISEYRIVLSPQSDGAVEAEYSQTWEVTGGHIPWVTVGMPNSSYAILDYGGAASSVTPADEGTWSGVRVDLDRDYRRGETFTFNFRVNLTKVAYSRGENVTISFTPGWYDRAETRDLSIELKGPESPDLLLQVSPEPSVREGGRLIWRTSLGRGERFKIQLVYNAAAFPDFVTKGAGPGGRVKSDEYGGYGEAARNGEAGDGEAVASPAVSAIVLIVVIIIFVLMIDAAKRGGYRGRRGIFYGSYGWPTIFGSSRSGKGSDPSPGKRSGGGGGFGGRASGCACVACACACVSCACACACAGGGGAGCARKFGWTSDMSKPPSKGGLVPGASAPLVAVIVFGTLTVILSAMLLSGCNARLSRQSPESNPAPFDENVSLPRGDPDFPPLKDRWVVDPKGYAGDAASRAADLTLDRLKKDGLAETVIVIMPGVRHPVEWATHYGRWLQLGAREGSRRNNGLVYLVIPDARPEDGRVWYTVGRGLPRLTSVDIGPVIEEAASYANAGDFDGCVVSLARNTDDVVRRIYGR